MAILKPKEQNTKVYKLIVQSGMGLSFGHIINIEKPGVYIREVKHDVYSKQKTAKMKLLPSVFSSLYSKDYNKCRIENQR